MIGAAGISAFPMSARVINKMGLEEDNQNFLLMHAVGVNVSGQIASVIARRHDPGPCSPEERSGTMIDNLSYVIGNALLGWLGVFIVTIILILLVYLFNYLFSNKS